MVLITQETIFIDVNDVAVLTAYVGNKWRSLKTNVLFLNLIPITVIKK